MDRCGKGQMRKILVIGCPGSGKSTLARRLRAITGLPLFHLDNIWHRADKTNISTEAFDEQLAAILAGDAWIIDGNYQRTMERRIAASDTVFFLDYPLDICLAGIRQRQGKARSDLPWTETGADAEFLDFVKRYPAESRPAVLALLDRYRHTRIIHLKSREEGEECLRALAQR